MALIPLKIPAGVYRNGTEYQSAGRWYDANLVRWFENTLRPIGGWRKKSTTALTGKCRGLLTWRDNTGGAWAAAGTNSKLYAINGSSVIKDITPSGLSVGIADATILTGYGYNTYGSYDYGIQRPATETFQPATTWSLEIGRAHV